METIETAEEILLIIEKLKERFNVRPLKLRGEEQDRFISYIQLKQEIKARFLK